MTRKRAKSADQTSLGTPGTTETAGVLRSPPRADGEPRRLLSFAPFQSSSGECRISSHRLIPLNFQVPLIRSRTAVAQQKVRATGLVETTEIKGSEK